MQNLFRKLHDVLSAGQDAVLVTIVAGSGSTPRGSGARMLVTSGGRIAGTIGGGAVEFEAEKLALRCLENKGSTREYFRLQHNDVADIGMICGGNVDVYFRYIAGGDEYFIALAAAVCELFEKGIGSWLITQITEDNHGSFSVYVRSRSAFGQVLPSGLPCTLLSEKPRDGHFEYEKPSVEPYEYILGEFIPGDIRSAISSRPAAVPTDRGTYYIEKLVDPGRVFIFGGGHVSQQLVPTLARCDFRCIIVEDRPEFTDPALFENKAAEIRLIDMERVEEMVEEITPDDLICIMTRGHKDDYLVQAQILKTPACYIGVIGSRHKIAGVNAKLRADGFTESDIARITTPIGLDIFAETPAEIAVSVAAQLIAVRARRNGSRKVKENQ